MHLSTSAPTPFTAQGRLIDFMREAGEPGLINFAAGVPGLDSLPTEELEKAFASAFEGGGAAVFAYQHPEGDLRLRDLLAERLRKRGAAIEGRQIVCCTGCTQALQVMLTVLLQPGDIVACEAPAYYGMLELLSQAGARVLPVPVRGPDGIDLAETEALLKQWKPRCLIVCTALSNPSGATVPEANREKLVELCRENGVRLIEDDIYGELVDGGAPTSLLAYDPSGATVSYVSSFSKSVSPGLRAGVCVPGTLHEDFATRKCQQDLHSATVTEAGLREFLAAGRLDPHLETLRVRNRRRRELAMGAIRRSFPKDARFVEPRGGYMLWVELAENIDLKPVREEARKERIVFASGDVFFVRPTERACLRLNCAKASEEELVRGLEILGGILCAQAE